MKNLKEFKPLLKLVDKGKVVATGTHEELLKSNETYKNYIKKNL